VISDDYLLIIVVIPNTSTLNTSILVQNVFKVTTFCFNARCEPVTGRSLHLHLRRSQHAGACWDFDSVSEVGYVQSVLCIQSVNMWVYCSSCFSVTFETMPALFSNEYADMVFVYGFCDGNAATAVA
jgi:hypothetical protein